MNELFSNSYKVTRLSGIKNVTHLKFIPIMYLLQGEPAMNLLCVLLFPYMLVYL